MAEEIHGMARAKKLFPAVSDDHLQRVLQSLELYDSVHQYLSTGHVPRNVEIRYFKRTITKSPGKPRYGLIEGMLF